MIDNIGISKLIVIPKTADETVTNSDAFQDDDTFVFALGASEAYYFRLSVVIDSELATDFKFEFTSPAGSTINYQNGTTYINASGGDVTVTCSTDKRWITQIFGSVINGATAGNLQFRWAQAAADVTNTIVCAGSIMELVKC